MKLLDYTQESDVLPALECRDRNEAIRRLVASLERSGAVAETESLVDEILRREAEGSTAIGGGLSIPHARFDSVRQIRIAVATLTTPLDIPSEDGQPVDVIILIVGPRGDPRQMLRVLARLARLVKHADFLDDLRAAQTPAAILAAIGAAEERYA
jgi:mannitol/fructose-specific phosphotransferase system IIA component (Ntr-type)